MASSPNADGLNSQHAQGSMALKHQRQTRSKQSCTKNRGTRCLPPCPVSCPPSTMWASLLDRLALEHASFGLIEILLC